MIKTVSGALNGALVLVTTVAFATLYATPMRELALILYGVSLALACSTGFLAIGGLRALADGDVRNARLCVLLAIFWTVVQVIFASVLVHLIPLEGWQTPDNAHLWLLLATMSQAALLAGLARALGCGRSQKLELE